MGVRNYLVEGVSGTGKTSVCDELLRRGHHAIHGDRELSMPSGLGPDASAQEQHDANVWDVGLVRAIAGDRTFPATYFCGGSRNAGELLDVFDEVFVLEIDAQTLVERLDRRASDDWGSRPEERALVIRLHRTQEDVPSDGVRIDATRSLDEVVDEIVRRSESDLPRTRRQD